MVPTIAEAFFTPTDERWMIVAHELGHILFNMGDMYVTKHAYSAHDICLMDNWSRDMSPHVDPIHKLWLGWAEPRVVEEDDLYSLDNVVFNNDMVILPRHDTDGREYYILENRRGTNNNQPGYNKNIPSDGVLIWHAIDNDADNDLAPNCVAQNTWDIIKNSSSRRGIRVIRPWIQPTLTLSSWDDSTYDLFDNGLNCGGLWNMRRNVLEWADGTPSGYEVTNWSGPGDVMSFNIKVP
jgi:hypothetical protein